MVFRLSRNWKTPAVEVAAGKTSDWVDVGDSMDALGDGQWNWTADGKYRAEFGVKGADGKIAVIATFTGEGPLRLAADAGDDIGQHCGNRDRPASVDSDLYRRVRSEGRTCVV